jgi:hypothetical protein
MARTVTWLRWLIGVGVLLVATPVLAGPVTAVAAGYFHTCAVNAAGGEHASFLLRRFHAERDREVGLAGPDRERLDRVRRARGAGAIPRFRQRHLHLDRSRRSPWGRFLTRESGVLCGEDGPTQGLQMRSSIIGRFVHALQWEELDGRTYSDDLWSV